MKRRPRIPGPFDIIVVVSFPADSVTFCAADLTSFTAKINSSFSISGKRSPVVAVSSNDFPRILPSLCNDSRKTSTGNVEGFSFCILRKELNDFFCSKGLGEFKFLGLDSVADVTIVEPCFVNVDLNNETRNGVTGVKACKTCELVNIEVVTMKTHRSLPMFFLRLQILLSAIDMLLALIEQ